MHWGVYSVPAFHNEWYSRKMYLEASPDLTHHRETYGEHRDFGYKDFIPHFTMRDFDPREWAALFKRAGAQFVVPVAEHHDGFAMYETQRSRWNAAVMGPCRDVFGELTASVDQAWMVPGASSHRAEHWFFMDGGSRFDSDVRDPAYADFYGPAQREELTPHERFLEDWVLRTVELIDNYRPQVLWFDWWIEQPAFEPYVRMLGAYYYNNRAVEWGREVVINYKWEAFADGSAVYDIERGTMGGIRSSLWQNDTAISKTSWSWVDGHEYKSVDTLVAELADTVSKNGLLLLNVRPKPDGTIPDAEQRILDGLGDWLTRNGEAIYGTRPWRIAQEGPTQPVVGSFVDSDAPAYGAADVRFTSRHDVTGDYVYAILLAEPEDGIARVSALGAGSGLLDRGIREVSVLGGTAPVTWEQTTSGLHVMLPPRLPLAGGPVVKLFLKDVVVPARQDFLHS
ncbi:alpha-L-fucosidase [Microbacterium sp. LWS13-1.2]|uniref:alpha-L-fucosidase n=1 Tax=Microbacterium sp. LWS13-1.2 TaxID=3135264 RepID=A0AAU6SE03_9MICO